MAKETERVPRKKIKDTCKKVQERRMSGNKERTNRLIEWKSGKSILKEY